MKNDGVRICMPVTHFFVSNSDVAGNKELPFVILAPILNDRPRMWFLARSADGERLMIIIMTYGMGNSRCEEAEVIPRTQNGTNLRLYPAARVYVFELAWNMKWIWVDLLQF